MSAVAATYGRELRAYFASPLGWLVLFFFLLVNSIVFGALVFVLNDPRSGGGPPMEAFFGGFLFWIMLIVLLPVLTMRLIAEELRSGTIEVLMTAPISEAEVVAGKYLAALTFYLFLWLPTLLYAALIAWHSDVDWGPIAAGYLGIVGIGALFLAIGLFASALSKNQLVAAMMSFAIILPLFLLGLLEFVFTSEAIKSTLGYINLVNHMDEFARGIVDTRHLVYYLSATLFFLFLTTRALEARKWR